MNQAGDQPRVGQRAVGHGASELLDTVTVVGGQEPEEGHEGGAPGGVLEVVAGSWK